MPEQAEKGILARVEQAMKIVAAACLMGMALVTGADVYCRAAFNKPVYGAEEIVGILAVIVAGFAMPYAHSQGSQIGVEALFNHLGKKTRNMLSCITGLTSSALFFVVAWRMYLYAESLKRSGQVSLNLELPTYNVVYALAFAFAVFAVFLLKDAIRAVAKGGR